MFILVVGDFYERKKKSYHYVYCWNYCLIGVLAISSYAYFMATVTGNGNQGSDNTSKIETAALASIIYNNGENFQETNAYPGFKNIHSFTLKPQDGTKGKANYLIHLNSNVATEFGEDIKISLYKSTNTSTDYLTRTEGLLTQNGDKNGVSQFIKEDKIETFGSPKKVYEGILTSKEDLILEEKSFDENMPSTTYYLVYEYLSKDQSQDSAQGKNFTGKITVSLKNYEVLTKNLVNTIKGNITTNGNGVYKVQHNDSTISSEYTLEEINNLKLEEYRYAGLDPNNYVYFNNELWRIIGFVNTLEGQKVKIIRENSIANYSWNNGRGNNWFESTVMKALNPGFEAENRSNYYNRSAGTCTNYNSAFKPDNTENIPCDFSTVGLNEEARNMIDTSKWNTSPLDADYATKPNIGTVNHFYNFERGSKSSWEGKVGLMYITDYGYSTSGEGDVSQATCINSVMFGWDEKCGNNSWLYDKNFKNTYENTHTISPSSKGNQSFVVVYHSYPGSNFTNLSSRILPSVYLKSNVNISDGEGTRGNPYQLIM